MAKKRKSIFDTPASQEEVKNVAKKLQEKTIDEIPAKKKVVPKPKSTKKKPNVNILYVDDAHHKQAKIGAVMREMKLGEYIEWLIDQDKNEL